MDFSKLTRNPAIIDKDLFSIEGSEGLYTKGGCKVYFPARFAERGMAFIGSENSVVGVCAFVFPTGEYSVLSVNAMVPMSPDTVERVNYRGVDYVEFGFEPGSLVINTLDLVKVDVVVYRIYTELISKGNVPWYIEYDDLSRIFDTASKHAGTSILESSDVMEVLVSSIARTEEDRTVYFRTTVNTPEDLKKKKPAFIGLMSAAYSATNTLNRMGGSYFTEGALSAMVYPTERVERIEEMVRA